jgi:hypothetical protein
VSSTLILRCHRDTPCNFVRAIKAFPRMEGRTLAVTYVVDGTTDRLRVPPVGPSRRAHGLWRHTCFEAFVATQASAGYCEFNFSPSGQWAVYAFRAYREGLPLENDKLDPLMAVRPRAGALELDAHIRLDQLPGFPKRGCFRLGLSAVLEDARGRLTCWALRHAPGKPDFHSRDSFVWHLSR